MSTTPVWACWDKLLPTVRLYVKESYKSLLSLDLWDGHCIQSLGESYTMFRLPDTRPMIPVPSSRIAKLYRSNTNATQVGLSPSGRKALQRTLKESSKWRIDNQGHANFLEDLCTFWSTPLGRIEGGDENLWSQVHIVPGFDRESKCLIIKWRGFDSWYWTVFFFGVPISVRNVNGGAILYLPKGTYRERFSFAWQFQCPTEPQLSFTSRLQGPWISESRDCLALFPWRDANFWDYSRSADYCDKHPTSRMTVT